MLQIKIEEDAILLKLPKSGEMAKRILDMLKNGRTNTVQLSQDEVGWVDIPDEVLTLLE